MQTTCFGDCSGRVSVQVGILLPFMYSDVRGREAIAEDGLRTRYIGGWSSRSASSSIVTCEQGGIGVVYTDLELARTGFPREGAGGEAWHCTSAVRLAIPDGGGQTCQFGRCGDRSEHRLLRPDSTWRVPPAGSPVPQPAIAFFSTRLFYTCISIANRPSHKNLIGLLVVVSCPGRGALLVKEEPFPASTESCRRPTGASCHASIRHPPFSYPRSTRTITMGVPGFPHKKGGTSWHRLVIVARYSRNT